MLILNIKISSMEHW